VILSREEKISRLFDRFDREHEKDAVSIIEAWRKETVGRGGVRVQGYPMRFVDRTPSAEQLEDMERDRREDEDLRARVLQREQNKKASKPRRPVVSVFTDLADNINRSFK
jgi:hypothetical protein